MDRPDREEEEKKERRRRRRSRRRKSSCFMAPPLLHHCLLPSLLLLCFLSLQMRLFVFRPSIHLPAETAGTAGIFSSTKQGVSVPVHWPVRYIPASTVRNWLPWLRYGHMFSEIGLSTQTFQNHEYGDFMRGREQHELTLEGFSLALTFREHPFGNWTCDHELRVGSNPSLYR